MKIMKEKKLNKNVMEKISSKFFNIQIIKDNNTTINYQNQIIQIMLIVQIVIRYNNLHINISISMSEFIAKKFTVKIIRLIKVANLSLISSIK